MNIPNDFDNAKPYDGKSNFDALPAGGHICRIIGARAATSRSGNEMIEVAFDIAEGGEYDGKFKDRFDYLRKSNPEAKWPNGGMFRTAILNRDGNTSGYFKGLITSVEESNPGYSFRATGGNEDTLKGKLVGFNFGEEEYRGNDGQIHTSVKACYAVSIARVRDGVEPPAKKAYRGAQGASMAAQGFAEVSADEVPDLPF